METLLDALDDENKEIILIGDMNCNDSPIDDKSTMIRKLQDLYRVYQMKQLIKEPTRSTRTTATVIDHFSTNKPNLIISSGVLATGFNDHEMIFGIRKVSSRFRREQKIIKIRQLKHYNAEKYREDLRKVDWESIFEHEDVNIMSLDWEQKFLSILDRHAPYRQRKIKNSYAAYIDKDLRHKMFLRDLFKKR